MTSEFLFWQRARNCKCVILATFVFEYISSPFPCKAQSINQPITLLCYGTVTLKWLDSEPIRTRENPNQPITLLCYGTVTLKWLDSEPIRTRENPNQPITFVAVRLPSRYRIVGFSLIRKRINNWTCSGRGG